MVALLAALPSMLLAACAPLSLPSHAAIVAREYGIRAIVGTQLATQRFNDDDIIRVDCSSGIVSGLKRACCRIYECPMKVSCCILKLVLYVYFFCNLLTEFNVQVEELHHRFDTIIFCIIPILYYM